MFLPTDTGETVTKENKTEPHSKILKKKKERLPVLQSVWTPGRAEAIWCRLVDSHPEKKKQKTKSHFGDNQNKQWCQSDGPACEMTTKHAVLYKCSLQPRFNLLSGCCRVWEGGGREGGGCL